MAGLQQPTINWRVGQLAELTAELAGSSAAIIAHADAIDDVALTEFWTHGRKLANRWLQQLATWPDAVPTEDSLCGFFALSAEILLADMLVRVWSTVLAIQDREHRDGSVRAVLDLVVFNSQHARHRLLELLLTDPDTFAELDRLRRRCERWTDLLLGPLVVRHGFAHYAYDSRRAWDYGEDAESSPTSDLARKMWKSGYRAAFTGWFQSVPLGGDCWPALLAGIDRHARHCGGTTWPARRAASPAAPADVQTVEALPALLPRSGAPLDDSPLVRALRRVEQWQSPR